MLKERSGLRFLVFIFILVFLCVGVTAVTINVRSYVEKGGILNVEGNNVQTVKNLAPTTQFSECSPSSGEYVTGLLVERDGRAGGVSVKVSCEKKGSGNGFTVNPIWGAKSPTCSVGPGVYTNIATASAGVSATFGCRATPGETGTGCSGTIPQCNELFTSRDCIDLDEADCGLTGGDCEWNGTICNGTHYHPECNGNTEAACSGTEFGCQFNEIPCSNYNTNHDNCNSHPSCTWGNTPCESFADKNVCKQHENIHDTCEWKFLSLASGSAINGSYTCPTSSPIVVGFAGFNGTGTSYCANDYFPDTTTYKRDQLDTKIAGLLPKCASIDNSNCAYRFTTTDDKCYWWSTSASNIRCPVDHYVNGVRGFIGNCGLTGEDVCAQVRCCSIEPADNSREVAGNSIDEDCDGLVDEGYFAPGTPYNVATKSCTGTSDGTTALSCELEGVSKSNLTFCSYEGAYFFNAISSDGTSGAPVETDAPQYLFTVNYDTDQDACICRFGSNAWVTTIGGWAGTTNKNCCENGAGTNESEKEFLIQGKVNTTSFSCCEALTNGVADEEKKLNWVSIGGQCMLTDLYWANLGKTEIADAEVFDNVLLVADHVDLTPGTEVKIEVYEDDGGDPEIRVGDNSLIGTVDENQNLVALWGINTSDMIEAGETTFGEGSANFYFKIVGCIDSTQAGCADIEGKTSDNLVTGNDPHDEPFDLHIISPICGDDYDKNSLVQVIVNASDQDDIIYGNLTIGDQKWPFTNGIFTLDYNFSDPGNIQVSVYGENTRGYIRRIISSIMIVDKAVDGTYVAACINKPADFSDIGSGQVKFEATSSRGIRYVKSTGVKTNVSKSELNFYWVFSDGSSNPNTDGASSLSYNFWKTFTGAGHNWATLEVEFKS